MYIKRCGSIYEVYDLNGVQQGYFGRVCDLEKFGIYHNGIENHWILKLQNSRPRFFLSYSTGIKYIFNLEDNK